MELRIVVTDVQYAGLAAVAKKDGLTVEALAQKQMDYYLNCVIKNYVEQQPELTEVEKAELDAVLAVAKDTFISELQASK